MNASVGLIALWTGELAANVDYMKSMAIHQMSEEELARFAKYVGKVEFAATSIAKYVKEKREEK